MTFHHYESRVLCESRVSFSCYLGHESAMALSLGVIVTEARWLICSLTVDCFCLSGGSAVLMSDRNWVGLLLSSGCVVSSSILHVSNSGLIIFVFYYN